MNGYNSHDKGQRGSTLVYFAMTLLIIAGFVSLALDGSMLFIQWRTMQNAADAAAMAGARALALGGTNAQVDAEVQQFGAANSADALSWRLTRNNTAVEVTAQRTFITGFARLFGQPTMTASAVSEASYSGVAGAGNLLPMVIDCQERTFGNTYRLWDNELESAGAFGWVDWNGGSRGNPELVDAIQNPSVSGYWEIGDWIWSGPGVQNSSGVISALSTWLGIHVTVPLYDAITGVGANTKYRICGFAEFVLTDFNFQGSNKYVEGQFIRHIEAGATPGGPLQYGLSTINLTQ